MTLSSPGNAAKSPRPKLPLLFAARPRKMLRTNSSNKISTTLDDRVRLLTFNAWEPNAASHAPSPPTIRRINGARPGRLALVQVSPASSPKTVPRPSGFCSPTPTTSPRRELDEAATKVQKLFKGHRTRRTLADCAIVVEELWWKLYDSASLDRSSISFFHKDDRHQETPASRWLRAAKRVAKVGKGLSKDDKAQKLALRHWLEAIDPRHRYGHNLHLYYDIWFRSSSTEPFFYWLDIGAGRDIHHPNCPRSKLHSQLIKYLGMNERAAYEVTVQEGKLMYRQSGLLVNTTEDSKWIFVLSTTRSLYVGQKKKGDFQHSSFLAGGATSAAGRLVVKQGVLKAIWPYSGHYLPTEENFNEFISFLEDNNVDLTDVKRCSVDDDVYPSSLDKTCTDEPSQEAGDALIVMPTDAEAEENTVLLVSRPPLAWTTGAGARIGCVRDYPAELQSKALEHVNLSPKVAVAAPASKQVPIPSPRPSPRVRLSPRVQYMGMPSPSHSFRPLKQQCLGIRTPTIRLTLPNHKAN